MSNRPFYLAELGELLTACHEIGEIKSPMSRWDALCPEHASMVPVEPSSTQLRKFSQTRKERNGKPSKEAFNKTARRSSPDERVVNI